MQLGPVTNVNDAILGGAMFDPTQWNNLCYPVKGAFWGDFLATVHYSRRFTLVNASRVALAADQL